MNTSEKIQVMRDADEVNRKHIDEWKKSHNQPSRVKGATVHSLCTMFYKCKEIIIHGWYEEDGVEKCQHRRYVDRFDPDILDRFHGYEVIFFAALKKGCIEIYACNFPDKQEDA